MGFFMTIENTYTICMVSQVTNNLRHTRERGYTVLVHHLLFNGQRITHDSKSGIANAGTHVFNESLHIRHSITIQKFKVT